MQKGFTLIELMVVIVIIGILSALAIPKMFGVSSKAKAAEAPGVIANWETLESAYSQETGAAGTFANIGFQQPTSAANPAGSKWFSYTQVGGNTNITATIFGSGFGACTAGSMKSDYAVAADAFTHNKTGLPANCQTYIPNF